MSYRLHSNTSHTIVLKKSEFITLLFRVESIENIKQIIKETRKQYVKASHICSAYRMGENEHSSDDGEPSGTAGQPMLDVLRSKDIDLCLALVVRYYGGIQLGASGLTRAYRTSVLEAIQHSQLVIVTDKVITICELEYALLDQRLSAIEKISQIIDKSFSLNVQLTLLSQHDITNELCEITNGSIHITSLYPKQVEELLLP